MGGVLRGAQAAERGLPEHAARTSSVIQPVSTGPGLITFAVTPRSASSWRGGEGDAVERSLARAVREVVDGVVAGERDDPAGAGSAVKRRPNSRMSSQVARALTAKCRSKLSTVVSRMLESTDSQWHMTSAVTLPSCCSASVEDPLRASPGRPDRPRSARRSRRGRPSSSTISSVAPGLHAPRHAVVVRRPVGEGDVPAGDASRRAMPAPIPTVRPTPVTRATGRTAG